MRRFGARSRRRRTLAGLVTSALGARSRSLVVAAMVLIVASPSASAPDGGSRQALISFDHYHTIAEIEAYLQAVTSRHDELVTLLEIGESRGGRTIWAVEINNPATGPAEEKPGFYLDGNIHGGELLGGEGAVHFVETLLASYGSDPRITEMVDSTAFYVVPVVNPDGRAISVDTPENHRWNIRPVDGDGDGRLDEDPPEDVDGDGHILQIRVQHPRGQFKISPDDPRAMVRRGRDDRQGPFYQVYPEGIDNDDDGRLNEDRVGGVDLNRNFPANWSPAQFASGPFPLSEPETWALVEYITSRPNIAAIHTYHTSGGLILRFPTLADQDWDFPPTDLEDYKLIAEDGVAITGYRNYAYEKQPIVDLMNPGHGVFNDWGSKEFGVYAITTEMWSNRFGEGPMARYRWNDEVLGGAGFIDWKPLENELLLETVRALLPPAPAGRRERGGGRPGGGGGPGARGGRAPGGGAEAGAGGDASQDNQIVAEIGGWDRFSTSNPPEHLIAAELERNTGWVLTFAEKVPRVAIVEATALPVVGVDGLFALQASVANVGWMPTATAHAIEVLGIAEPVVVEISLTNAVLPAAVPGRSQGGQTFARETLGNLSGARPDRPAKLNQLFWNAEVVDASQPASAEIVVRSQKAGVARVTLELKN